jgi:ribonuclease BN (tRNA processing enzyme)
VSVTSDDPRWLTVLDAGTGIRELGAHLDPDVERIDILLTHLHLDHILGLGFFAALRRPDLDLHIWGPGSTVLSLQTRLSRYLSPPLFPVRLRDVPCRLTLHEIPGGPLEVPGLTVRSDFVCHPGPTLGYRVEDGRAALTYIADHEPALGAESFPEAPAWTSGFDLAEGADVLIHDSQYNDAEYRAHVGWGHSAVSDAVALAKEAGVRQLVAFHHDPSHDDAALEQLYADPALASTDTLAITPAREGTVYSLG